MMNTVTKIRLNSWVIDTQYAMLNTLHEMALYKRKDLSITVEESLQIAPFYAKQTQFPTSPNERKC